MRDRIRETIFNFFRRTNGTRFTVIILILYFLFCCALTADAGLMGFHKGNDQHGVVADIVGVPNLQLIGKIEINGDSLGYEGAGDHFGVDFYTLPYYKGKDYPYYLANWAADGALQFSGSTWQIGNDFNVDYFVAKAGPGFNLYSWDDENTFQEWSTYNTCASLSHLSFYGTPVAVPEPSSFLMLCSLVGGLLVVKGVCFVRSR
jgi:hypothetical protein